MLLALLRLPSRSGGLWDVEAPASTSFQRGLCCVLDVARTEKSTASSSSKREKVKMS